MSRYAQKSHVWQTPPLIGVGVNFPKRMVLLGIELNVQIFTKKSHWLTTHVLSGWDGSRGINFQKIIYFRGIE